MKRIVVVTSLAIAAWSARAPAQEPTGPGSALASGPWLLAPPAQVAQLAPRAWLLSGEPTGPGALSPWVASTPMRLSLSAGMFPRAPLFPNCATREGASANAVNGFATQRYALLPLAPNLALHGFSSAGCPIDGAVGGALTFAAPLRGSWWLVAGGGIYGRTALTSLAGAATRARADARIDLVHASPQGTSVSVGLGRRGIAIGGTW